MKTKKGTAVIYSKPVLVLFYSDNEVKLRAEDEKPKGKLRFDQNFLSEDDLDRILAIV